jgi:uncharacterized protein (UPF0548 family)
MHKTLAGAAPSFPFVGATRVARPPEGYYGDRQRLRIGWGEGAFHRAARALRAWSMFATEWTRVYPEDSPLEAGADVLVLVRLGALWTIHPARIVELIEEETEKHRRFGFAYATLPGHALVGEERFVIEQVKEDNSVWYELLAYSRPAWMLARLAPPLVRMWQKQFGADSKRAMGRAMAAAEERDGEP